MFEISKKTTIIDVARLSGFSISTVSRVLNGNYPVKNSTKKKILEAIETLEFSPNILARGLIGGKTYTIGIIVPTIENLFFSELIRGIDDILRENDYTAFICSTNEDDFLEKKYIMNLVDRKVDGIITISPNTRVTGMNYEEVSRTIPVMIINGEDENLHCHLVSSNQEAGTLKALNYLIEEGHRKIAFLRGHDIFSYNLKEELYRNIMKVNDIEVDESLIININAGNSLDTVDESQSMIQEMLQQHRDITALFACNDLMAVGALNAALKLKIKVPQQLRIVGFDNTLISELTHPKLSSVDQNMKLIGTTTAKRLMEIINGEMLIGYERILIDTELIIRET